jgi:fructose-specific phosphotransferase system component IIB
MNKLIFSVDTESASDESIKNMCVVIDAVDAAIVFGDENFESVASVKISIPDAIKLAKTIIDYYG